MKKITFLLLILSFSISVNSQITITASENVFIVGDNIQYNELDITGPLDVGASGADVVWDFTSQTENGITSVFDFIDSAGLPHINEMPGADLASMKDNNPIYSYIDSQGGTAWKRSGVYSMYSSNPLIDFYMFYQDLDEVPTSLEEITYPITFGATQTQEYKAYGLYFEIDFYFEYFFYNAVYSYIVDGWGELQLPHHTYPNALRVLFTEEYDTLLTIGITHHTTIQGYKWYVPEVKGAVFSYYHRTYDGNDNYYAIWHKADTNGINEELSKSIIKVFPNPANGVINISSDNEFTIYISDISGKIIYESKDISDEVQIDLTSQNKGVYFAKIVQDNKVITKEIILK